MLRFDLELKLLEGRLRVKDLPEAWRAGMQAVLGIMPLDDRDGCLQECTGISEALGVDFRATP